MLAAGMPLPSGLRQSPGVDNRIFFVMAAGVSCPSTSGKSGPEGKEQLYTAAGGHTSLLNRVKLAVSATEQNDSGENSLQKHIFQARASQ